MLSEESRLKLLREHNSQQSLDKQSYVGFLVHLGFVWVMVDSQGKRTRQMQDKERGHFRYLAKGRRQGGHAIARRSAAPIEFPQCTSGHLREVVHLFLATLVHG